MTAQFRHRLMIPLSCFLSFAVICPDYATAEEFWGVRRNDDVPLEPTIGVGPDRVVQVGNFRINCYTRQGQLLWKGRLNPVQDVSYSPTYFWEGLESANTSQPEDPKAIFDPFSGRFVVIAVNLLRPELFIAVSRDSAPADASPSSWDRFLIPVGGVSSAGNFHFLQLAVNGKRIWITGLRPDTPTRHAILALKRPPAPPWTYDASYYEQPGNKLEFFWDRAGSDPNLTFQFSLPAPAQFFEESATDVMYFAQKWRQSGDQNIAVLRLSALVIDANAIPQDPVRVEVTGGAYGADAFPDGYHQLCSIVAPAGPQPHENVQNAVFRNGNLYFARISYAEDEFGSRHVVSWYMVPLNGWPASGQQPGPVQHGYLDSGRVFDPSGASFGVHFIYPYVMPTANGDMALFASRVIGSRYIDLVCTGHRVTDPPGVLGAPLRIVRSGEATVTTAQRWGDYEGIALDPLDPGKVWVCGELGRCPPPSQSDSECGACTSEPAPSVCTTTNCFYSYVATYTVPQGVLPVLSIRRQLTDAPAESLAVKIMPMDVNGAADVVLDSDTVYHRTYGAGTSVTLLAPKLTGSYQFRYWTVDDDETTPPPGADPRLLTIVLKADTSVTPVYKPE